MCRCVHCGGSLWGLRNLRRPILVFHTSENAVVTWRLRRFIEIVWREKGGEAGVALDMTPVIVAFLKSQANSGDS